MNLERIRIKCAELEETFKLFSKLNEFKERSTLMPDSIGKYDRMKAIMSVPFFQVWDNMPEQRKKWFARSSKRDIIEDAYNRTKTSMISHQLAIELTTIEY